MGVLHNFSIALGSPAGGKQKGREVEAEGTAW